MNDYCKQLFEGDAVNFNECGANEEEEQQDEENNEFNWYGYDMEDADDMEGVCAKIVSFNGVYNNYYDSAFAGSVHKRDKNGNIVTNESTGLSGLSVSAIVAIVVAIVMVIGFAAYLMKPKKKVKSLALHEPVYQGGQLS